MSKNKMPRQSVMLGDDARPMVKETVQMMNEKLASLKKTLDEIQEDEPSRGCTPQALDGHGTPDILKYHSLQHAFDNVDSIHDIANKRATRGLRNLRGDIKYWSMEKRGRPISPPKQMECLLNLAILDDEKRKELHKSQREMDG